MELVPINFDEACAFVKLHHTHHKPPAGHKFSIAAARGNNIVAVAIVGRPVARGNQDGWTLEVVRLATDRTPEAKNACSMLYGAARRAVLAMGYKRLISYILDSETGKSLIAAGWQPKGTTKGGSWDCPSRPRVDKHSTQPKIRFEI